MIGRALAALAQFALLAGLKIPHVAVRQIEQMARLIGFGSLVKRMFASR